MLLFGGFSTTIRRGCSDPLNHENILPFKYIVDIWAYSLQILLLKVANGPLVKTKHQCSTVDVIAVP